MDDERVPGPGSLTWRYAGDPRVLGAAGYALLLQLAHPTVAAGVNEHSDYRAHPWRRLTRSIDYLYVMAFGGEVNAIAMAARLRERHASIKGIRADGTAYSAFEPEAWNWVQATLADAAITGIERFGHGLTTAERDRLWAEFAAVGRLVGAQALPADWLGYVEYREEMAAHVLRHDRAIDDFLQTLSAQPGGALVRRATIGLAPPALKAALGLRWTQRDERILGLLSKTSRALNPIVRGPLRNAGPTYLRARRLT